MFFSKPGASTEMLKTGGMLVVEIPEEEVTLPLAARMVECALIIYLVAIAICTLAAWLY
jgi:positive regulator of sigma E activity